MIPLYQVSQVAAIDKIAIEEMKYPGIVLMENAAISIVNAILEKYDDLSVFDSIGFLCGKGNNGGDGFAVARHFANAGFEVVVLHLGAEHELANDAKVNFGILKSIAKNNKNVTLKKYTTKRDLQKLQRCSFIVDALLGSGTKGALREPYKAIAEYCNQLPAFIIAVDLPTGIDADTGGGETHIEADFTVTLAGLKRGLFTGKGFAASGDVVRGSIGIDDTLFDEFPVEDYLIEPEDALLALPEKKADIHKYSAGKVLTIAGSDAFPGAALMTAKSAMTAGAGASILSIPLSLKGIAHSAYPELVVRAYDDENCAGRLHPGALKELSSNLAWADVIALGPGLGRDEETLKAVRILMKKRGKAAFVIDADGLYPFNNGEYKKYNLKNTLLTPHTGEFAAMLGIPNDELQDDMLAYGKEFAGTTGAFLLLKSARSILFTPGGEALINSAGNPGMAKFGTGDVLTGMLAGFIAQTKDIEQGAIAALYLHSLSADLLAAEKSEYSYSAVDIMDNLPAAINFLRSSVV